MHNGCVASTSRARFHGGREDLAPRAARFPPRGRLLGPDRTATWCGPWTRRPRHTSTFRWPTPGTSVRSVLSSA
jgi:hypothetical protein